MHMLWSVCGSHLPRIHTTNTHGRLLTYARLGQYVWLVGVSTLKCLSENFIVLVWEWRGGLVNVEPEDRVLSAALL